LTYKKNIYENTLFQLREIGMQGLISMVMEKITYFFCWKCLKHYLCRPKSIPVVIMVYESAGE